MKQLTFGTALGYQSTLYQFIGTYGVLKTFWNCKDPWRRANKL